MMTFFLNFVMQKINSKFANHPDNNLIMHIITEIFGYEYIKYFKIVIFIKQLNIMLKILIFTVKKY